MKFTFHRRFAWMAIRWYLKLNSFMNTMHIRASRVNPHKGLHGQRYIKYRVDDTPYLYILDQPSGKDLFFAAFFESNTNIVECTSVINQLTGPSHSFATMPHVTPRVIADCFFPAKLATTDSSMVLSLYTTSGDHIPIEMDTSVFSAFVVIDSSPTSLD